MKICYFGIYDPRFGRNKVYMTGLKQLGHEVVECRDSSAGPLKYWRLWQKHRAIMKNGGYDAMIVGYPGHIVVPFAKLLSKKPVIFDALCSLYEGEVLSRGKYRNNPPMHWRIDMIDRRAARSADLVLVETNAQRDFFTHRFSLKPKKVIRIFTGADEDVFYSEPGIAKHPKFTAVFRGKFLPEAGVSHTVRAAKLLEHQDVDVLIIGNGHEEKAIQALVAELKPQNLSLISENLPADQLRRKMLECRVSLGQFENHERLQRTIPHKAFESLAMKLPYVTGRAGGIQELLVDGKDCLMTNLADPEDIAAKILKLKNEPELGPALAENGRELYDRMLTPRKLAADIVSAILNL